jgi:hypothetical protein
VIAYGFVRGGLVETQLGPIGAAKVESGLALLEALIAATEGALFMDVPISQPAVLEYLQRTGWVEALTFVRMYYGPEGKVLPPTCIATVGPEFS